MSDPVDVIHRQWPYDGPHDRDTVASAAEATAELIRYLNNATRSANALDSAAAVHDVLSRLGGAAHGLDQLLRQLGAALHRHAEHDPGLYDDRDGHQGGDTAQDAAEQLQQARQPAAQLAERLDAALARTTYLGSRTPT